MPTIFIAGIDTDIGKTIVTGHLAKYLKKRGKSVITQKLSQTGNDGYSEDIAKHREIMGEDLLSFDKDGTTCPYIFKFPSSPHLASSMESITIDINHIDQATRKLEEHFDYVLVEGVGGLAVPLTPTYTTLDFLEQRKYPTILVSSPKLGSINHTLLSLEVMKSRNIPLKGVVYNWYPDEKREIGEDSIKFFSDFLENNFNEANISECFNLSNPKENSFEEIFGF